MPPEEDRATSLGKMHKNLVNIGRVVSKIWLRTDTQKQTDIQTRLITILRSPIGGGVLKPRSQQNAMQRNARQRTVF